MAWSEIQNASRKANAFRPGIAILLMLVWLKPMNAQETSPAVVEVARPSVEELAIPAGVAQRGEGAGDSNTREAICLMIESAATANDLPLEFFARVIW